VCNIKYCDFTIGLMNVRSVCNKAEAIHELIVDKRISFMCQTDKRRGDAAVRAAQDGALRRGC
jgi:hypothetical protein